MRLCGPMPLHQQARAQPGGSPPCKPLKLHTAGRPAGGQETRAHQLEPCLWKPYEVVDKSLCLFSLLSMFFIGQVILLSFLKLRYN